LTHTRRLSAFDIGFQELVDEIRFEVARQMLEDSRMEILEISALLDYAGPNARGDQSVHVERGNEDGATGHHNQSSPPAIPRSQRVARGGCSGI
jgi:hypothetical protein